MKIFDAIIHHRRAHHMTVDMVIEGTGESYSVFNMCPLPADQLLMDNDIILGPAIPYIDINELVVFRGKEDRFTSFTHPDIPEVMPVPASSDNDSPVRDMSSVSMSVSSDRETNRGPQQTRQTRQTRHPPTNISAADAGKKKNKTKWSNAETNALISAVDKHGLKLSLIHI